MKLLFVVHNYYPSMGGTQIFFQKLAENCVNRFGFDVQVFTTDSYFGPDRNIYKKIQLAEENINGVKVKRFPFRRWHRKPFRLLQILHIRLLGNHSQFLANRLSGPWSPVLEKEMANTDADMIIGSSSGYMYMRYPLKNDKKKLKPFIFQGAKHFNEKSSAPPFNDAVLAAIKKSSCYLSNTVYEKKRLVEMGVDPHKIEVLGSAVEPKQFNALDHFKFRRNKQIPSNDFLIGCVGRIHQKKDIDVLIKAIPAICKSFPDTKLVIAGYENGYANELKQMVNGMENEVQTKIHFELNPDESAIIDIYHAIDLLVLPSISESFGMVFLEAWACKKPVIGANIGAIASVISNGKDGLLFEPGNGQSLKDRIIELIEDPVKREKMGECGFEKLMQHYTWDVVSQHFKAICIKALENDHLQRKVPDPLIAVS